MNLDKVEMEQRKTGGNTKGSCQVILLPRAGDQISGTLYSVKGVLFRLTEEAEPYIQVAKHIQRNKFKAHKAIHTLNAHGWEKNGNVTVRDRKDDDMLNLICM